MEPREAMDICLRVLKESKKSRFDSCSVRNSILIISHITFRDCRVHIFPTTFLEIAVNIARAEYFVIPDDAVDRQKKKKKKKKQQFKALLDQF